MIGFFKRRRREKLKSTALPAEWVRALRRNVPYVRCLPEADRRELFGLIQVFLDEKNFEGAGGLAMTDEIRVTIAAQACILLLHRKTDVYPNLQSIIVYPYAYVGVQRRPIAGGAVIEDEQVRAGESWTRGAVVLSWHDVVRGASDIHDGRNVVFHEFAHQLDGEAGGTDGAPNLPRHSMYVAWARVLGAEYKRLVAEVQRHRATFLDPYAATNPAEFFAVVTEFFFERPLGLRERCPELYEQLKEFYHQDPAEGIDRGERPC